jgi:Ca-activated chloride channel family protein
VGRGRHRRARWPGVVLAAAAGLALILILVLAWNGYRTRHHASSCSGRVSIAVAAAPEITPAVQTAATRWAPTRTVGACVSVTVTAADPSDVAAAVAGQRGVVLNGLGQANGRTRVPDVWIPDSSTWLTRLRAASTDLVQAAATPIASSPIVLAVPRPEAETLGWAGARLTWTALLQKMSGGATLKAGIVEPGRDAASLNTLLALNAVAASMGQGGQEATVAALRALAVNRSAVRADLLARFPRAGDPATLTAALSAAPLPEQAVIAYNAAQPPVPLAVLAIDPAPAPLDYPFVIMPGTRSEVTGAATALQAALAGSGFRDQLAQLGLRAADGSTGTGFSGGPSAAPASPASAAAADPMLVNQAVSTWTTITQAGRILAVIDVSGSMLTPVPTAGGATREQVTIRAAAGGLALFDDTWAVGLWTFSTNMDGPTPYKQLVPIGPLSSQRQQLTAALGTVAANPRGDTALYQTLLAAYQTVQAGWDSSKVNSVVLITDGMNDNPGGMTLDQLTSGLKKIADPHKPVQIIILGIGTAVPKAEMQTITQITGGGVFIATDPSSIGRIFLQAIALRPGTTGGN